jgi:hypothetical protein
VTSDRNTKKLRTLYRFFKEYWIEVLAFTFGIVGILLLVEPFDFRNHLVRLFKSMLGGASTLTTMLSDLAHYVTLNELLGWGLATLAAVFILWRARVRFLQTNILVARRCPRCESHLVRIHRRPLDRFLCLITQIEWRRYRCENPDCSWSAVRRRRHHRRHEEGPEEDLAAMGGAL